MENRILRNTPKAAVLTAAFLLCQPIVRAAENYATWAHSTDVVLNTSASGANVAGTVGNFPVLVRLNSSNFPFSQARGDGHDIRFARADGAALDFEIERWDSVRADAAVWVRTDVSGNTAAQTLRMYWGNVSAPDSSDAGAVFRAADGYVAAWHLNTKGTAARPNAVTGGNPAVPNAYDGDESREGIIAGADSLDGGTAGDYLDLGDGYSQFSAGFTFSIWAYPSAVKKWAHILDLGNGEGSDNIIVNRVDTTTALGFHNWSGGNTSAKEAANQWVLNQWQLITVTMSGKNVRMYKNGAQILADTLPWAMTGVQRTLNFIGKSNWAADEFFRGKVDEPELSKTVRSPDWIRLAYQNQKAGQSLVTVVKPVECAARISVPGDTSMAEGETLILTASVECATDFSWSVVSGPSQRILDPHEKVLVTRIPRVKGDTNVVYRLTAGFSDSTRIREVRIGIKEAIPDPVFTMPAAQSWNGKDSLAVRPVISNLAAIKASKDSVLHWAWTLSGPKVDTSSLSDGVMLRNPAAVGAIQLGLCLDNGSDPVCATASVNVSEATSLLRPKALALRPAAVGSARDAMGRSIAPAQGSLPRWVPRFRPAAE